MYIPLILGTAREGRQSEKVAKFIYGLAQKAGLETEIVDIREYRIVSTDNTGNIPHAQ
jgi:multimeric flavodoxin WrbA